MTFADCNIGQLHARHILHRELKITQIQIKISETLREKLFARSYEELTKGCGPVPKSLFLDALASLESVFPSFPKGKVHKKKVKKKLTSVSFAFTHTYTLEKLTLLLFSPKRIWKILKNVQNAKEKTFHFITLSQEQLKVQYIFEERHRPMKENCLWGRCKKSKKKLTILHFRLHIHT